MNGFGTFVQLVADGLAQGSLYAALALAIVLVNQATGLINFAQGGMAVLGSYIGMSVGNLLVPTNLILGVLIGIIVAVAASFGLGALIERFVMRRFQGGEEDTKVVATIGLLTLITGIIALIWGYNFLPYPFFFNTGLSFTVGGIAISLWSLTTFLTIVALMIVLQLLFTRTKVGLGLRAVADNPNSSALSGIRVGRMLMIGWGLAAALGTIAGILLAAKAQLNPGNFDAILVYALAAVIIGGVDSPSARSSRPSRSRCSRTSPAPMSPGSATT
ncbi:branched-chain amino acid ABC transporter permease [Naasia aerilata]|uniref:Branched-chain amino acid ABC transporter permease n=1 Tax=Naasia aerilata TaxID=1162966 RepID=A0ABN6XRI6_9MICO|nr:branched-chain amino acid ABC transporter permease [Naasia aerilata]BDZ46200.1 branched-chain amino acid ABC transporter permease [Naasia aerilata]